MFRSQTLVFAVLLLASFTAVHGIVSTCLEPGNIALSFDGGPSAFTPKLLATLKSMNTTALFHVDSEKITLGGMGALVDAIKRDNHILGLFLNLNLEGMSHEGIRGTVENRASSFYDIVGKWPLFIRVPAALSADKQSFLESSGYLITKPGLDLSGVWAGNCVTSFNSSAAKSGLALSSSLLLALPDTDTGCKFDEVQDIVKSTLQSGYHVIRMDKCINLANPYRRNPADIAYVSYTIPDNKGSSSTVTSTSATFTAATGNDSVKSIHLSRHLLIAAFVFGLLCLL